MLGKRVIVAAACMMVGLSAAAQELAPLPPQPEGLAWPTDGWEEGALPEGVADDVQALVGEAMQKEPGEPMGVTRAVVIIHDGKLVLEAYRDGFGPETKQVSWSMAKSITSALVGRAVELGLVEDIDAPMPSPFEDDDPRSEITWRQWLTMTDGLDYLEIGATSMAENDVIQMMYGPGRHDVIQYVVSELEPAHEPGRHWNYSTAGFHLIGWALQAELAGSPDIEADSEEAMGILQRNWPVFDKLNENANGQRQLGSVDFMAGPYENHENIERNWSQDELDWFYRTATLTDFMHLALFEQIGIDAQPEFDAAGTHLGGSLVWASARDFAKFGYLYLRDGVWEGERLLPEGWVDFSRTDPDVTDSNIYGAGWWITPSETPSLEGQAAVSPPYDAFSAQGHEGQTIWVVPSRDLVIVRLGLMPNGGDNWPALYEWNQQVARAFPETRFASNSDEAPAAETTP
ncbi:serine hydrolase [Henriciella sp.]|uniref:serine hydrolase domain-containing protein n=1 Tax=Henriciella sp. TaxID=1968823 RepID=UPI00262C1A7A|nr:serine hydrolase [Henriciella sp.]